MAEYLIREESLADIADAIRTHWGYFDDAMQMITNKQYLSHITIPDSVTNIDSHALSNCYRLTDMYLYPITPPTLANTSAIYSNITTIHVPVGSGNVYKSSTNWSSFADKIVEDIEI